MVSRFCPYCRQHREDIGFKPIFHLASKSKRMQCGFCQDMRKKPRETLVELAKKEGEARRKRISEATKRGIEQRRKNENLDSK